MGIEYEPDEDQKYLFSMFSRVSTRRLWWWRRIKSTSPAKFVVVVLRYRGALRRNHHAAMELLQRNGLHSIGQFGLDRVYHDVRLEVCSSYSNHNFLHLMFRFYSARFVLQRFCNGMERSHRNAHT